MKFHRYILTNLPGCELEFWQKRKKGVGDICALKIEFVASCGSHTLYDIPIPIPHFSVGLELVSLQCSRRFLNVFDQINHFVIPLVLSTCFGSNQPICMYIYGDL